MPAIAPRSLGDFPQLLQPLQERRYSGLPFRIVLGQVRKHADATHSLRLLRARRERPCRRRAAEQRDEVAPPGDRDATRATIGITIMTSAQNFGCCDTLPCVSSAKLCLVRRPSAMR